MASDARISVTFAAHPKTKKLIRRHGHAAGWGVVCLFLWTAGNRPDGDLTGMTSEDIELAVDWGGDDGALVAALKDVGFLDGEEGSYSIHDWAEHNPWAAGAKDRSEASKFAALCKRYGRERAADIMPDYADRTRPAREADAEDQKAQCPDTVSVTDTASESLPPKAPKGAEYPHDFESFWTLYPNKVGKDQSFRAWKKIKKARRLPSHEALAEAIGRYIQNKPADVNYKNPATWLNGGCWQDEWGRPVLVSSKPEDASDDPRWKLRMDGFDRSGFWNRDQWGPAPNEPNCQAPAKLLANRRPILAQGAA